jgi:hypothetical protein
VAKPSGPEEPADESPLITHDELLKINDAAKLFKNSLLTTNKNGTGA